MTETKTTHTPGPFAHEPDTYWQESVEDGSGFRGMIREQSADPGVSVMVEHDTLERMNQAREFIVCACNAHDELVEVCAAAEEATSLASMHIARLVRGHGVECDVCKELASLRPVVRALRPRQGVRRCRMSATES